MFASVPSEIPGVVLIEIERPPANAMGLPEAAELAALLAQVEASEQCRVLVFAGKGRFFSAGADIKTMQSASGAPADSARLVDLARTMQRTFDAIEHFPAPTIAAINGIATGGGLELALACDLRIAAEDARIGLTETRIGLIPGAGGTQRLVRIAGRARALRMILAGEMVAGAEAARFGMVHEAVAATEVRRRALALAGTLAALPRAALRAAKRCIALAPSPQGYAAEIEETERLHGDDETRAAIRAFLNRSR
ncbi:MAG: enoyl-CoA hydratase/isomerase family protein [Burkholderiales bacterium]|nr:enoyl-CoA hydratase/isomerase family protein [Burkholderiales bacterium]